MRIVDIIIYYSLADPEGGGVAGVATPPLIVQKEGSPAWAL